jgi:hypothetical protein
MYHDWSFYFMYSWDLVLPSCYETCVTDVHVEWFVLLQCLMACYLRHRYQAQFAEERLRHHGEVHKLTMELQTVQQEVVSHLHTVVYVMIAIVCKIVWVQVISSVGTCISNSVLYLSIIFVLYTIFTFHISTRRMSPYVEITLDSWLHQATLLSNLCDKSIIWTYEPRGNIS